MLQERLMAVFHRWIKEAIDLASIQANVRNGTNADIAITTESRSGSQQNPTFLSNKNHQRGLELRQLVGALVSLLADSPSSPKFRRASRASAHDLTRLHIWMDRSTLEHVRSSRVAHSSLSRTTRWAVVASRQVSAGDALLSLWKTGRPTTGDAWVSPLDGSPLAA